MEAEIHEKYEYARDRIKQKKNLLFHFVVMLLGGLFLFIVNYFLKIGGTTSWYQWVLTIWFFAFILHFIKVYVTDRFMNKSWERAQIDRLVAKQDQKLKQLEQKISDGTLS